LLLSDNSIKSSTNEKQSFSFSPATEDTNMILNSILLNISSGRVSFSCLINM